MQHLKLYYSRIKKNFIAKCRPLPLLDGTDLGNLVPNSMARDSPELREGLSLFPGRFSASQTHELSLLALVPGSPLVSTRNTHSQCAWFL